VKKIILVSVLLLGICVFGGSMGDLKIRRPAPASSAPPAYALTAGTICALLFLRKDISFDQKQVSHWHDLNLTDARSDQIPGQC